MFPRLLPTLLLLCLLAGLQGAGLHVHWHGPAHDVEHAHVATALDPDHAQAHADGEVDEDSDKLGSRAGLDLPPVGPAAAIPAMPGLLGQLSAVRGLAEQRIAGPPRFLTPPGQAPPPASVIA
ncbi:MAG TPA: hypothetical protein VLI06_02845 [Solimonas sp.]|nr:hypothetical protein [Solimonas sp.]